jgi:hypothetical protein
MIVVNEHETETTILRQTITEHQSSNINPMSTFSSLLGRELYIFTPIMHEGGQANNMVPVIGR